MQVTDPEAAIAKLLSDGTLPAGLQGLSPDRVTSLLQDCITSVSQLAEPGNGGPQGGGAADVARGSGGSGGGFDDGTNGKGNPSAYSNVAYPSSSAGTQSSSTASDTTSSPPSGGPPPSSPAAPDTPSTGDPTYASNLNANSPTGFSTPSYPSSGTTGNSSTGAVSGTSGYPSNPDDLSSGGTSAAAGYPSTFRQSAKAGYASYGNGGDGQESDLGAGHSSGVRGNANGIQRTTSSGCDGTIACTNVDATSSQGSAKANPAVMEKQQADTGLPAVGEVKTGCPNKDVKACVDTGSTR